MGDDTGRTGARFRRPHERHDLAKVTPRTRAKALNTVIEPGVDVDADVAAINAGLAVQQGDRFIVNGRTYGIEPMNRLYPIRGPGSHQLGRGAFRALGVYNRFGSSAEAETILDRMEIRPEERLAALNAWMARGTD